MAKRATDIVLLVILLAGLGISVFTAVNAYGANGTLGFPLDDPWIHLQFAKNLNEHGAFSYFRDEMVTSGSTAPLYTILLALGFFLTGNEFLLSYVLGALFYLAAGFLLFRLSRRLLGPGTILPLAATAVVMMDPRLHWVALSGMETTMFIALLLAACVCYVERRSWLLGVSAGLLLWVRPEAVLFYGALAVHWLYHRWIIREEPPPGSENDRRSDVPWKALLVAVVAGSAYALFNLALSGSLLPNTYGAKLAYYATGGEDFPAQVVRYLSAGHQTLLAVFVAAASVLMVVRIVRRRRADLLFPLLWCLALIGAYWWKLPYLYQNGRYLMPVIPFTVLIGFWGIRELTEFVRSRMADQYREAVGMALPTLFAVILATQALIAVWLERPVYQESCGYILERQVRAAKWIEANLPPEAVVATHDIGAIGFYSGRRIVDMVGLVSPEAVKSIGKREELIRQLTEQGVTHVAVLRSWFEIVNVNPLFQTDERFPETMEVFAYQPEHMLFTEPRAAYLTEVARASIGMGDISTAGRVLTEVVAVEPLSSRARYLYAWAALLYDYPDQAEREVEIAIHLHPEYWDAYNLRAEIALSRSAFERAEELLNDLLRRNPRYAQAYQTLSDLYRTVRKDSARAGFYEQRYRELRPRSDAESGLTP